MIILDSSFIISFEITADQNHEKAVRIMEEIDRGKFGEAVISDYLFDEIITVSFGKTRNLKDSVFIGNKIMSSFRIFEITEEIFEEAWKLFCSQKDTKFSFTDCSILAVMEKFKIRNIATFDKDFSKIKWVNVIC
mgnify:CR=1 FL=1